MRRGICAVVLLTCLTRTEAQAVGALPTTERPGHQQLATNLDYHYHTYYSQIRRGTTEKAAIELVLGGGVFITTPRSPVSGILPLKLELDSSADITVNRVEYPRGDTTKVSFLRPSIPTAHSGIIKFRVRADRHAEPGVHILRGKLTFQTVTAAGISAPQQMEVQVPLTVVEQNARVAKSWPYSDLSKGAIIALIVLAPVAIVLIIPMGLACEMGFDSACF